MLTKNYSSSVRQRRKNLWIMKHTRNDVTSIDAALLKQFYVSTAYIQLLYLWFKLVTFYYTNSVIILVKVVYYAIT